MGGPSRFIKGLQCRSDAKLTLQSSPSGQQQRLWPLPAAVCGEFFKGKELVSISRSRAHIVCHFVDIGSATALTLSHWIKTQWDI